MSKMDREKKIEIMKNILKEADLKNNFGWAKKEFAKILKDTDADEISLMEQSLISEGYAVEKIQNLCDLHVSVFESSLKKQKLPSKLQGHPINTFLLENKEIKKRLNNIIGILKKIKKQKNDVIREKDFELFKKEFESFKNIEKHYLRKENQLFPYLERKGFTGPSKVMWAKDDEIRSQIKEISSLIEKGYSNLHDFKNLENMVKNMSLNIKSMIFKEEKILFPASSKKLSDKEWLEIKQGESQIGYSWIIPGSLWDAYVIKKINSNKNLTEKTNNISEIAGVTNSQNYDNFIKLDTGRLNLNQLDNLLKTLPVDISFIDENDKVAYYSNNADRIFPRSPAVIGREVQNCHPPKSLDKVNKIIQSFKNGEKDNEGFWINLHGRFIYIRYFAVRDNTGKYLGTLEVSQDITDIKNLEGEKRLLSF